MTRRQSLATGVSLLLAVGGWQPALGQVSCVPQSQAQLLQSFSDSTVRQGIKPQQMRNFVCSTITANPGGLPPSLPLPLSNWSTAGRPASPLPGNLGFNSDLFNLDLWTGSRWINPIAGPESSTVGHLALWDNLDGTRLRDGGLPAVGTITGVLTTGIGLVGGGTSGVVSLGLGNSPVSPGTFGDGTHVGQFTVDQQGRLTAAVSVPITGAAPSGAAGGDLSGTYPDPTVAKINGSAPAAVATSGSASDLGTGTLPNSRLAAVPNTSLANSSVTVAGHAISLGGSQALSCSDLTGAAASCSVDTTNASNVASGTLAGARLPVVTSIWPVEWPSSLTVTAETHEISFPWTSGTITKLVGATNGTGSPSFSAGVKIAGVDVTGCTALTVNSTSETSASCSAANTFSGPAQVTVTTSGVSGLPNQAYVSVVFTHTVN